MPQRDESFLFGRTDESTELRNDDAVKRGASSIGGLFALLNELDYFKLIEKLVRGPVTEEQVLTSGRWWIFSKGSKLAGLAGIMLLVMRLGLLCAGEDVDQHLKFSMYLLMHIALTFAFPYMFVKYLVYPDGVTWAAVRYTLQGFSVGLVLSEGLKSTLFIGSLIARPYVSTHWYHKSGLGDALLEMYYDSFVISYIEEVVTFAACVVSVYFVWVYVSRFGEIRRQQLEHGKPYALGL